MIVLAIVLFWVAAYLAVGIILMGMRIHVERVNPPAPAFQRWLNEFYEHYGNSMHPAMWLESGYCGRKAPYPRPSWMKWYYVPGLLAWAWPICLLVALFMFVFSGVINFFKNLYTTYPKLIADVIGGMNK